MERIANGIDRLNRWVGRLAQYLVLILILVTVYEVVMRRIFGRPTVWGFELSTYLYGVFFMLAFGYTHSMKGHVSIDILEERLSPKARAVLRVACFFVFFVPFVGIVWWQCVKFAATSWSQWEHSWTPWKPPIYPIKTFMPLAFGLLLLQGAADVLRDVQWLLKRGDRGA